MGFQSPLSNPIPPCLPAAAYLIFVYLEIRTFPSAFQRYLHSAQALQQDETCLKATQLIHSH